MRRRFALAILAPLAFAAWGNEGTEPSLSTRTLAAAALPVRPTVVSFKQVADPLPEILLRQEYESRTPRASCETTTAALCYDLGERRVQYRQARRYMPGVDGLRAESVSLRHNTVVFKYSFR